MKSQSCRFKRWCDHCDSPDCTCECHFGDKVEEGNSEVRVIGSTSDFGSESEGSTPSLGINTPPPHPEPLDHGRWRIAEEPLGADLTRPWEEFLCLECREPAFRHDPRADLCESCSYLLVNELAEKRVGLENRAARKPHNPFA